MHEDQRITFVTYLFLKLSQFKIADIYVNCGTVTLCVCVISKSGELCSYISWWEIKKINESLYLWDQEKSPKELDRDKASWKIQQAHSYQKVLKTHLQMF